MGLSATTSGRLSGGLGAARAPAWGGGTRLAVPMGTVARPGIGVFPPPLPSHLIPVCFRSEGRAMRRLTPNRSVTTTVSNLEPRASGQGELLTAPCERSGELGGARSTRRVVGGLGGFVTGGASHTQRECGSFFSLVDYPRAAWPCASECEMAELLESSGLHSLASLREHEKQRVQQQAEAARARAEAEQRARHAADREAARIESERQRAERAAQELAESSQGAELLRMQLSRNAEFERAEGLLLVCAGLSEQLGRERDSWRSTELALTSRLLRQRLFVSVAVALPLCTIIAATGVYFGALRPSAEHAMSSARQALLDERRARTEAQASGARSARHADELAARLGSVEQTLRTEREQRATPAPSLGAKHPQQPTRGSGVAAPPVKPCRDDGDPLNPCLKR